MFFLSDRLIWLVLEKIFVKHAILKNYWFGSVQLLSHVQLFVTPWTAARQASLSFDISQSLLTLMSFGLVMPPNHRGWGCPQIRGHPLLSPSPAFNLAQHQDLF